MKTYLVDMPVISLLLELVVITLDARGETNITFAQSVDIVRGEQNVDTVVAIEPLRVMIHLLCAKGHLSHEAKCLVEVLELEFLGNGITARGVH